MQEEKNICKNLTIEGESDVSIVQNQAVTMEKLDEKFKREFGDYIKVWEKKYSKDIEREANRSKKKKGKKKKKRKKK